VDPDLLSLAPAAIDNVYHVGQLVPDLHRAMTALSRRLQLTWAPPFQMMSGFARPDGEPDSDEVRIALSAQGPPYLELIEVVPRAGSIFAEPAGGGFHHIGFYAERWRDEVARLTADGMELERTGPGVAFVRDPDLGVRFEVVSFKGRDFLERILSGEMAEEHPLQERREHERPDA
jgi:catechol 2,3-dioxygenase-like lactoylglutathione lyase family enzyme